MNYDDYINILKEELLESMVESSFKFLVSKLPFLSWGPLAPVINLFLTQLCKHLINKSELAAFIKHTDFRVSKQGRKFYAAMEAYQNADPNNREAEKRALKDSFRNLISLTN